MKSQTFTAFGVLVLTTLALAGCSGLRARQDAAEIQALGEQITTFTLPKGYRPGLGVEVMGYQMINLAGPTPEDHIYIVQAPPEAAGEAEKLQRQAEDMRGGESGRAGETEVVERRPVTIRGEATTLVIAEGVNSQGQAYRTATAVFKGNHGPALVSISSPTATWDWNLVEAFLASLR